MKTTQALREGLKKTAVHAAGQIRRMAISLTGKALWQLTGFTLLDGKREAITGEPFLGIGFHARPSSSGKPEAIVLMVGDDSKSPVVVAVRDEATRQAIAGTLAADESAMFNSKVIAVAKADSTFVIRTKEGTAIPLATKADLQAVVDAFNAHAHQGPTGPTGAPIELPGSPPGGGTALSAPSPTGTTVLKAE